MNDQSELLPTRQTLLGRLKDSNDQESWKEFFDTYWKLIYQTAVKAGLTDAEAQDVVQDTILSVWRGIGDFQYRREAGSFKSWLLQLTQWRISDRRRRRQQPVEHSRLDAGAETETATVDRVPDPASLESLQGLWEKEWRRNLADAAVERVKRKVDGKQFQLFDLYVLRNWPVSKIMSSLKVSAVQVYLAKHRVSASIRKEVKYLEGKWI